MVYRVYTECNDNQKDSNFWFFFWSVYNSCKVPSNHKYNEEAKVADILLRIRQKTKEIHNETDITTLLALGYLLDDSNNKKIMSGQSNTSFIFYLFFILLSLIFLTYSKAIVIDKTTNGRHIRGD